MSWRHSQEDSLPLRIKDEEILTRLAVKVEPSYKSSDLTFLPLPCEEEQGSGVRRSSRRSTVISTKSTTNVLGRNNVSRKGIRHVENSGE